jgi:hypothetical protein
MVGLSKIDAARRLAELTHLREHYAGQNKPYIVGFLDRLIDETRAALASGDDATPSVTIGEAAGSASAE